eukprot:CAMPEP_0202857458 /NCGR_PEP_ID=MMETSP1391-20130828/389_1 /ASSEMBLY_ACC=CAM_ASM_000867 /TAXON_ID=1034604 /ORGANISM="Chlamydomonas leiostraca, Strain SAG 11-49" /LENGTH=130 /DNA_ID=CAMNT_0049536257 /DNA_START=305 /DNA_END=695 /DNA_ORIENTATION=-
MYGDTPYPCTATQAPKVKQAAHSSPNNEIQALRCPQAQSLPPERRVRLWLHCLPRLGLPAALPPEALPPDLAPDLGVALVADLGVALAAADLGVCLAAAAFLPVEPLLAAGVAAALALAAAGVAAGAAAA